MGLPMLPMLCLSMLNIAGLVVGTASSADIPSQWRIIDTNLKALPVDGFRLAAQFEQSGTVWAVVTKDDEMRKCRLVGNGLCAELVQPYIIKTAPFK